MLGHTVMSGSPPPSSGPDLYPSPLPGRLTPLTLQEIAVMSGIAAAERLGAEYPFPDDPLAVAQFDMYLGIAHGASRRPSCKQ